MKTPLSHHKIAAAGLALGTWMHCASGAETPPTTEQLNFFEKKIRPILVEKCSKCHGSEGSPKAGLRLDSREAIRRGGDSGPAVIPGDTAASLLMEAIRYGDPDTAMPPKKSGGKLPDTVIADFESWIKMGAPDPRDKPGDDSPEVASQKSWSDYGEATKWWSWQLPQPQIVPVIKDAAWIWKPLDAFVSGNFEKLGLQPVADAEAATWIRRIYFDIIGLPPRPQEVIDFVKAWQSDAPKARSEIVDKLLGSPQYGERWGRHWLDVARFAESTGKDVNTAFPHAWRYRDYVIASFNADKPFNTFIAEQIAGDLLPAKDSGMKASQTIATGFLAIGSKSLNEQNPRQFALDVADEQIDTLSQAFLATTVACARCHDHKFDPIPQREYYALAGIFLSTDTRYGTANSIQSRHGSELIELPADCGLPVVAKAISPAERQVQMSELEKLKKERDSFIADRIKKRNEGAVTPQDQQRRLFVIARIGQLETALAGVSESGAAKSLCMGVLDQPSDRKPGDGVGDFIKRRIQERFARPSQFMQISNSPLYIRGDADKPGERIPRGFISVLSKGDVPVIKERMSGRLELAEWVTSPGNPLTARVIVNRAWHWVFGKGLVTSVDNFGTTGNEPSNPALLDYLALHFQKDLQWSVKSLVRELVLSHTYGLSSKYDPVNFHKDPENASCWRMNPRRMDAECIRDAMLAVSSTLDLRPPVGSTVAFAGDGPIGGPRRRSMGEKGFTEPEGNFRSIYLPTVRDLLPTVLDLFDAPDGTLVTGRRESTNTPTQALFLMNSEFVAEQAELFAKKLLKAIPPSSKNAGWGDQLPERVRWAYALCFSRWPTADEMSAAQAFFNRFPSKWEGTSDQTQGIKDPAAIEAAYTSFCRALFGSAEFRQLN